MAEATASPSAPLALASPALSPPAVREQWEGEFSRFFNFQCRHSPTVDAALRPLSKGTVHYGRGTWLTASSPATILIFKSSSSDDAVLSVSISGYIHEEHIVSNLHLTWPQVACAPRGSRVVFMSYMDCSNQIQKFVVRFLTCADAATFICFFKDCSRDTMDFAQPTSDFLCDSSSPSEKIASNALQYKFNEGQSYEEAIIRDMPSPAFGQDESYHPQPLLVNNCNTIVSGLPPSFTELLTNCSKYQKNEISKQLEEADHTLGSVVFLWSFFSSFFSKKVLPRLLTISNLPPLAGKCSTFFSSEYVDRRISRIHDVTEADIKNEIARYMSDASFHDLLFNIEKVVHELGGDLSL